MAKSKTKSKQANSNQKKNSNSGPRKPGNRSRLPKGWAEYDRLIRDPCAAPFASPPYAGGTSGYLHRVSFAVNPSFFSGTSTVGTPILGNFAFQIQPSALPGYLFAGCTASTAAPTFGQTSISGTFLQNAAVRSFRPVAACAKWVPTGAISTRAGMVSLGYSQGAVKDAGNAATPADLLLFAQDSLERCPNGSGQHEIRWIPCPPDESYSTPSTSLQYQGVGTMMVSAIGVDCVYNSTTTVVANGYLEISMVYEWVPNATAGLSTSPECPPSFTSQQYQASLGDLGRFLLSGARQVGGAIGRGAMHGFSQNVVQGISALSSYRSYGRSQPYLLQ